jgi:hypothetical protein
VGVRVTAPDIAAASAPAQQNTATAGAAIAAVPVLIAAAAARPAVLSATAGLFQNHSLDIIWPFVEPGQERCHSAAPSRRAGNSAMGLYRRSRKRRLLHGQP